MRSARLFLYLLASVLGMGCMTPDLELARSFRGIDPEEKFLEKHHYRLDDVLKALRVKRSWFTIERTDSGDEWQMEYFHKHCTYRFWVNDSGKITWAWIEYEPLPGPSFLDRLLGISATTFVKSDADMKRIVNEEGRDLDRVLKRLRLQRRDLAVQAQGFSYEVITPKGRLLFVVFSGFVDDGPTILDEAFFVTKAEDEEQERFRNSLKERR